MPQYSNGIMLVWHLAAVEAEAANHRYIEPAHFFNALCKSCDLPMEQIFANCPAELAASLPLITAEIKELREVLRQVGLNTTNFRRILRSVLNYSKETPSNRSRHRSPEARRFFDRAESLCEDAGIENMRVIHLLWSLMEVEEAPWTELIRQTGIEPQSLVTVVREAAVSQPEFIRAAPGTTSTSQNKKTPLLDRFGRDLTHLAKEQRLDPTIGRKHEMKRLARILLQEGRNNAILVGEAGVGKTCIVEGLAQRMANAQIIGFQDMRIIEIPVANLVAGTTYRGEFEERLQGILKEAQDPRIVVFFDEIHMIVGAGAAGNAMDAANILKPALARHDIRCIGATTTDEYQKYFARDEALNRRFQMIQIQEPTREETLEIIVSLKPRLEAHHGVSISDEAVQVAVDLSIRYATTERLPDKAKSLLDDACSQARLISFNVLSESPVVGKKEVAIAASERYGVPVEHLTEDETERLLHMEEFLRRRVKGQEQAISEVCDTIRQARSGLRDPKQPVSVFLFLGPTGTGKTELAKALAEFLYHDEGQLIREDMTEYADAHAKTRLVGAPPSYVGFDEQPQLLSKIRMRPSAVVLLDEIEKAHPEVHQLFLQVFDEGRLTDSHGKTASFREAIIIMTSNLGAGRANRRIGILRHEQEASTRAQLEKQTATAVAQAFSVEFLNRIKHRVLFYPLDRGAVQEIIDKIIKTMTAQRQLSVTLDQSAYDLLIDQGYSETFGAREMQRAVERLLAKPLSTLLLHNKVRDGQIIRMTAIDGRLGMSPASSFGHEEEQHLDET